METTSIIALTISILSILATVWNVTRTNRITKDNHRTNVFHYYTQRYNDILMSMPDEMVLHSDQFAPSVMKYMTAYYDLCSEEHHQHCKGKITDDVWGKWVEGMRLSTRAEVYKACWHLLEETYNEEFQKCMRNEIFSHNRK